MECNKIAYKKTVLVLNSTYEPLNRTSWKRARVLVLKGKAHVESSRTIRMKYFVEIKRALLSSEKPSRSLVLKRDKHTCQYCDYSGPNLTIDHVVPKSRGGGESWGNLVTSCLECNNCKDNRTPEEWAQELRKVFSKKTTNLSAMPYTWNSFQVGMIEARIRNRGTVLASKPKPPFSKISIVIDTSEVDEWRNYVY